ncbi:MAG: NUDIX hydrolase [Mycobacteriales bacterium]
MNHHNLNNLPIDGGIAQLSARSVFSNDHVTVFDDEVRFADGHSGTYLRIVEAQGRPGVAMIATHRDAIHQDRVALVRTFRYTLQRFEWGIPRGFGQHADPALSARAELVEELGAAPDRLRLLATMTPNSGLLATSVSVFAASYPNMPTTPGDTAEVSAVRWPTWSELLGEISDGRIIDGFTLAAVGIAYSKGLVNGG